MAAETPWRNRIVGSEAVPPSDLLANPNNWRTHPGRQRDALRESLGVVGWVQQVIVNTTTGHLVDGHARVEEAISRDEPTVPVLYVELTPDEEALVLATLDPIGAMADRDGAKLEALLADISVDDAGLLALLGDLGGDTPKLGLTDPDDAPDLGEGANIKRGDLFALGDHRLLCGDATDAGDYQALLGSRNVDMVWTDPPWNVAIGQDSNPRHRQRKGLVNDNLSPADFAAFLKSWMDIVAPLLSGDMYCVLGASEWPALDTAMRAAGMHWSATVIWVKDLFVLGRSKYHRRYEPIWYGWPATGTSSFGTDRSLDDVWEIPRPRRSESHPTMKPVALVERSIVNSSARHALVLDPFIGSGTTIVAAEQLGRRCYGMEIDPRYVAVAVKRWEDFTGRTAERIDG